MLLTQKELVIAGGGAPDLIRQHSEERLKQYIKLVRKLRDKYRDLGQRQKAKMRELPKAQQSLRTLEKAKIFDQLLNAFEEQSKVIKVKPTLRKIQGRLDHEQHYDIDGVTRVNGILQIPSYSLMTKDDDRPVTKQ